MSFHSLELKTRQDINGEEGVLTENVKSAKSVQNLSSIRKGFCQTTLIFCHVPEGVSWSQREYVIHDAWIFVKAEPGNILKVQEPGSSRLQSSERPLDSIECISVYADSLESLRW